MELRADTPTRNLTNGSTEQADDDVDELLHHHGDSHHGRDEHDESETEDAPRHRAVVRTVEVIGLVNGREE
jgi:hypothetical protein